MAGLPDSGAIPPSDSTARQAAWEVALQTNHLPGFVRERLKEAGEGRLPWLSTMTPSELLLSRSHGIKPVATVMGTCALHYGYSWTRGHAEGWRTAVARMKQEALAANANAVVDVKMRTVEIGGESNMDYTLVGTAVRVEGLPPSKDPIIATLPALEFARLLEAGIVPVGIAIGAHYEFLQGYAGQMLDGGWTMNNQPLTQLGSFWERVRLQAILDLQNDTRSQDGSGVLAHTHFGQLLKVEGGQNQPLRYLGRHIVMGTVIDTISAHPVPHEIRAVVDMRDGLSPLNGGGVPHNTYPVASEGGVI
jgi:uncharacterized protein YbjQ (UPF0145 family)